MKGLFYSVFTIVLCVIALFFVTKIWRYRLKVLFQQPLFLMALCIVLGGIIGKLKARHFSLGSSATLFVALALSFILGHFFNEKVMVSNVLFHASMLGFISAVGLQASKTIKSVLLQHGFKFIVLSIVVTASGMLTAMAATHLLPELKYEVVGTYVGSLTSSPGLGTALELGVDYRSQIGVGYAIAYVPGVLAVILVSQWLGRHKSHLAQPPSNSAKDSGSQSMNLISYFMVIVLGMALGSLEIPLYGGLTFSLGIVGGTLMMSLILGASFKTFQYEDTILNTIKGISLQGFLSIVGLNYGYSAVIAVRESGLILMFVGICIAMVSIIVGYFFGKIVYKLDLALLMGCICGAMTSTPGLASALEHFDQDEVIAGYGATYPFALLCMILFTNILI